MIGFQVLVGFESHHMIKHLGLHGHTSLQGSGHTSLQGAWHTVQFRGLHMLHFRDLQHFSAHTSVQGSGHCFSLGVIYGGLGRYKDHSVVGSAV